MDTQDYRERIDKLEGQLQDKQAELDGVQTKYAALQLKNIAGLGSQVEEFTSLNEQLAVASDKMSQTEQKIGRLVDLERQLKIQQDEITRLNEENSSLRSQKDKFIVKSEKQQEVEDAPEVPEKTALQIRIEKMHNELILKERKKAELKDDQAVEQEEREESQAVTETAQEEALEEQKEVEVDIEDEQEEKKIVEEIERDKRENEEVKTNQSSNLSAPHENPLPKEIAEEKTSSEPDNPAKTPSTIRKIDSDMLPQDVLEKWLGTP